MKITRRQRGLYSLVEIGTHTALNQSLYTMRLIAEKQNDRAFFHEVVAQKGRLNNEYEMYVKLDEMTRREYNTELCKIRPAILLMIERLPK